MFSWEHAIWKFANDYDKLDDWLARAEDLVRKWSVQNSDEVRFQDTVDVVLAALLLEDDLLPVSARVAFAKLMVETVIEASKGKLRINCLHIHPPKPGRKNCAEIGFRCHDVYALIREGMTATEAYEVVAKRCFKSPDTIRRDYERTFKKISKRKETGENEK